jgi:hypothetical protein
MDVVEKSKVREGILMEGSEWDLRSRGHNSAFGALPIAPLTIIYQ